MKYWNIPEDNDLSRELKSKYRDMKKLFDGEILEEDSFTDCFLEIYEEIHNKLVALLIKKDINQENHQQAEDFIEKVLQKSFNTAIEKIIDLKTWSIKEIDYSLFLPWTRTNQSSSNKKWYKVRQADKYNTFLKVYYDLFLWNKDITIDASKEKLDNNKVRKFPYKIVQIQSSNFSRTILISDQIWEITFVYDWIIDTEEFQNIKKWAQITEVPFTTIKYGKNYASRLKETLSPDYDFTTKREKRKYPTSTEAKKQIYSTESNYLDQQELFQTLHNYQGKTTQESYEYFMNLPNWDANTPESIRWLNINWKSGRALKTLSWIKTQGAIHTISGFQKWINKVFEWQDIEFIEPLTTETLITKLHKYKWSIQESYEYFMNLPVWKADKPESTRWLKIQWKWLIELVDISWIEIQDDIYTLWWFQKWINIIFKWQDIKFIEPLTTETLITKLQNYKWGIQESYEYFMNLPMWKANQPESIRWFKIQQKSILALRKLSWIKIQNDIYTFLWFREWINHIFEWRDTDTKKDSLN